MQYQTLEQVIRQYVSLSGHSGTEGWIPVLCKICNDHGRKGARAGFKFEGSTVGYHCFNCGHKAGFDPSKKGREGQSLIHPKMVEVLEAFDIPDDEWKAVLFQHMKENADKGVSPTTQLDRKDIEPKILTMPGHFYPLADAKKTDKWADVAREYLEVERHIDPAAYPFHLSRKTGDAMLDRKWMKRIIVPIFKDEQLIYYIGRALTDVGKRYESPKSPKSKVLYGFDQLFKKTDNPLYVVEGFFDAFSIDGIALLGNELSEEQVGWLDKSRRKKVYIPDRLGRGRPIALDAVKRGWSISIPDTPDCKDVNEAICKYGKLYVMKSLIDNTVSGFEAQLRLNLQVK